LVLGIDDLLGGTKMEKKWFTKVCLVSGVD